MGDAIAKELDAVTTELALGDIDDQAVLPKSLEQQVKMFLVRRSILASHQNVINVNESKILNPCETISIRH